MAKGIDRAAPISADEAKTLAQYGYSFIIRYYSDSGWKRLTKAEALHISAAGMYVGAVFENANNDVKFFTYAAGLRHAASAIAQAKAIGQPTGLPPIYFAVDFQALSNADFSAIYDYFRGVVSGMKGSGYPIGVYGSYAVCKNVPANVPGVAFTFQTLAWSGGQKLPSPNLYQWKCDTALPEYPAFGNVDLLVSNGAGGGWKIKA